MVAPEKVTTSCIGQRLRDGFFSPECDIFIDSPVGGLKTNFYEVKHSPEFIDMASDLQQLSIIT